MSAPSPWILHTNNWLYIVAIVCSQFVCAQIVITIINPPTNTERSAASAAKNRANAIAMRDAGATPDDADTPVVVLPPDADIVFLDAAGNNDKSGKHLRRARSYRLGDNPVDDEIANSNRNDKASNAELSATRNQSRAMTYQRGGRPIISSALSDLPVVACKDTNNIVGRIGEDNQTGKVIYLVKGQQKIKVRCL